jgi:hypothetical protein
MNRRFSVQTPIAVGSLLLFAAAAFAQPRQESPGGPPGKPRPIRLTPPGGGGLDLTPGVQVNTGPGGMNIVGDAANEPSMTVDPTAPNRIAVGWRQFDTISSNFRQAGRAYSRDGGRTWTNPGPLTPGVFRTDPVLDTTAAGTFYYYSLFGTALTNCDLFRSNTQGASWLPSVPAHGGDKNWLAIDHRAIAQPNLYIIWSPFFSCCGGNIFGRSIDGGATFQPPLPVPESPYFGTICVGPSGSVYAAGIRMSNSSQFAFARSMNASNPAVTPIFDLSLLVNLGGVLLSNTGTGPNPGGLNGQVWCVADPRPFPNRDHVYLLCTVDPPGVDPGDVMFVRSFDGGETWSAPVRVNDDAQTAGGWQWMGTIGVAPNGRIDAVWIDTRASQQANLGRLYYSFSNDSGTTWSANQPITDQWNSFVGWPQQNKIGDYYQLASDLVGANLIYAATFNGEQDIYFLRLGEYDCNGNGIPDSVEIANNTVADCNFNGIPDSCEIAAGLPVNCFCYGNCDQSTLPPVLNVNDFICFQSRFAAADPYADCDRSGALNVNDFVCFQTRFAAGCP